MSREVKIRVPKLAIAIACLLLATVLIVVIIKAIPTEFPLSSLEHATLEEQTAAAMNYFDELDVDNAKDSKVASVNGYPLDRYIAFALEYNYNENDKSEITATEIKDLLESVFDYSFDADAINKVGISSLLVDKNVTHDPVGQVYSIKKLTDKRVIADIPVTKYIPNKEFANRDKTIYTVVYDKYTAKSPYDVLPNATGDVADFKQYLEGNGKIKSAKNAINKDNASQITEPSKQLTIQYSTKDGKLRIKSIK